MEATPAGTPGNQRDEGVPHKTEPLWARLGLPPELTRGRWASDLHEHLISWSRTRVFLYACVRLHRSSQCREGNRFGPSLETAPWRQHGFTIFGHHGSSSRGLRIRPCWELIPSRSRSARKAASAQHAI